MKPRIRSQHPLALGEARALRNLATRAGLPNPRAKSISLYQRLNEYEQERKGKKMNGIIGFLRDFLNDPKVRAAALMLMGAIVERLTHIIGQVPSP